MESLQTKFEELFHRESQAGTFTKASITVVSQSGSILSCNYGMNGENPITENTQFDVASVTKTVPVSTLALIALDRKWITLDTPVSNFIPNLALRCSNPPLFRHLLTQTLDFGFSMAGLKDLPAVDLLERILTAELKAEPGEKFYYCNATSILLGLVVESVFGESLDSIARNEVFSPLGMNNTTFRPDSSVRSFIVPTEKCSWRNRSIQGEIHDESAWKLNEIMIPGAAGLFSTTQDLSKFLRMVINDGANLFSPGFIESCAENYIPSVVGAETALGFEFNQPYMGDLRSGKAIGKTGFTGSVIVADLERKSGFALLTDYTWPKRKVDKVGIMRLRSACSDLVWRESGNW